MDKAGKKRNSALMGNHSQRILQCAIIGAGFAGIGMGIQLRRAGIENFTIFEKTGGISGTWYDNTYPGAACDVPSHLYSYSFAKKTDWSRIYAPQAEIRAYVEDCARRFGVSGHVRLNTAITAAHYDDDKQLWQIITQDGEKIRARFLISASGPLNIPAIPPIEGLDDFSGPVFHSARWRHDVDMRGKRVAIIGSAASAIQIAPKLAGKTAHLDIFQRTANYIMPRRDRAYKAWEKTLWRTFPFLFSLKRAWMAFSRDMWTFRAFRKNSLLARLFTRLSIASMHDIVHAPQLRAQLTPPYQLGCKRILLSDDYYQTLLRADVALHTDGIARITAHGIETKNGADIAADIIIMATGFEATSFMKGLCITGANGKDLHQTLAHRMSAYRGVSYPGFPNFFTILGPNTGLGHSSMILIIEAQIGYILKCIQQTKNGALDVRAEAESRYTRAINKAMKNMVWAGSCSSWYKAKDGSIPTLWPHSTAAFARLMAKPDFQDYEFKDTRQ